MPTTISSTSTSPISSTSPLSTAALTSYVVPIGTNKETGAIVKSSSLSTTTNNSSISISNANKNTQIVQLPNYLNSSLPTIPLPPPSPFANGTYIFNDNTVANEFNYATVTDTVANTPSPPQFQPILNSESTWIQKQHHLESQELAKQTLHQQDISSIETFEQKQPKERPLSSFQVHAQHRSSIITTQTNAIRPQFVYSPTTNDHHQLQYDFTSITSTASQTSSTVRRGEEELRISEMHQQQQQERSYLPTSVTPVSTTTITTPNIHPPKTATSKPQTNQHVFPTAMLAIATAAPIVVDLSNFKLNCLRNNEQQQLHMHHLQYIQHQQQQHQQQFNQQLLLTQQLQQEHQPLQPEQQQQLCQWESKFDQHYPHQQF